jgi:hypothetical protein
MFTTEGTELTEKSKAIEQKITEITELVRI